MRVTECRVKLAGDRERDRDSRLMGYATLVLDDALAIRELRVIEGQDGHLVVAMPSRKMTSKCDGCSRKNIVLARYCSHCGRRLPEVLLPHDEMGRPRLYADVCHPITAECRRLITEAVVDAYLDAIEEEARVRRATAIQVA